MSVTYDPVRTLAEQTPPHIMQVGDKRVYDNFDLSAFFELWLDHPTSKKLNGQDMIELEQWIGETTKRSINYATKVEAEPDWNHWQRCLGWFPMDIIKKTAKCTTNYAIMEDRGTLKRHRKSRHPQLNRKRLMEKYATDTWFASVKAMTGESCGQIFVGMRSYFTHVIGMKSESEGPSALKYPADRSPILSSQRQFENANGQGFHRRVQLLQYRHRDNRATPPRTESGGEPNWDLEGNHQSLDGSHWLS